MAESYDRQKTWHGRTYTGMKVGRTHTWDYEGEWKERKVGPDLWDVSFRATKRRRGKAPEGSGAPAGTEYLWFFAPTAQAARKMDANTYETHLEGLKWKIGFRPATSKSWDYEWAKTGATARQRAIRILEQTLADLKADERAGAETFAAPDLQGERPVPAPRGKKKPPNASATRGKRATTRKPTAAGAAQRKRKAKTTPPAAGANEAKA